MNRSVRLSEKWFNYVLWGVSILFAFFLMGLGSLVVESMPKLGSPVQEEQFMNPKALEQIISATAKINENIQVQNTLRAQAYLTRKETANAYRSNRETFDNWIATRGATQRSEQNPEVVKRVRALDNLKEKDRQAELAIEAIDRRTSELQRDLMALHSKRREMSAQVHEQVVKAQHSNELHIFLYRLAFTLPLLVAAGWLFKTKRKSANWPFVMGFSMFALCTFFFELVPYLPSYGGYVRYIVGIAITVIGGKYAVKALQSYREQQALEEKKPDEKRRLELSYDLALARIAKRVCPGCERPVELENKDLDFCHHCGIAVYNRCVKCSHRKSAFSKFCMKCGSPS